MENNIKQIALDKKSLYVMAKWHNLDDYDYNGIVKSLYQNHKLIPSKFISTDLWKAPIMNDGWVKKIYYNNIGDRSYRNLFGIIELYEKIVSGEIELFITPTVSNGIQQDLNASLSEKRKKMVKQTIDFIEKYATYLTVEKKDYKEFFSLRKKLVDKYFDEDIFNLYDSYQAESLAEAVVFGLQYVIKREETFIHEDIWVGDCNKAKKIESINKELGFSYYDENGGFSVPRVWTAWHIISKDRQIQSGVSLSYKIWGNKGTINNGKFVPEKDRPIKNLSSTC